MAYTPRTTIPTTGDLRWTNTAYGGYNNCILGSPSAWNGSVMANCTGYVHGRWMELGNVNSDYGYYSGSNNIGLSLGDARSYYGKTDDGFARGQEPQLGAIICLGGGSYGHVAIVEEILDNGDIMCSESNYSLAVFEYVRRYKSLGYKRSSSSLSIGGFQGFIYHPNINPPAPEPVYNVTVVGGSVSPSSGHKGDVLSLTANVPSGYKFVRWSVSGSGTVTTPTLASTTFTVGESDSTITAILAKKSSGMSIMFYISPPIYRRH